MASVMIECGANDVVFAMRARSDRLDEQGT